MLDNCLHYPDYRELNCAFNRLPEEDRAHFFQALRAVLWPQTASVDSAAARTAAAKQLEKLLKPHGADVKLIT